LIPDGVPVLILTVPMKPWLLTVTVEDAEAPAMKLFGVGSDAVIVKSGLTRKGSVAE